MSIDSHLQVTELASDLVVLTLGGETIPTSYGANCVAVAGTGATLVVDPLIAPAHARLVEGELIRRGFPPVTIVVLTHHHTDHALGAGWLGRRGARVVAHRACAEAMAREHAALVAERRRIPELAALFADAEPHAPTTTYDGRLELAAGGLGCEVRHVGPAHTAGDSVVWLPSRGVLVTGDVVLGGYHFNYEDAVRGGLDQSLEALERLRPKVVIPGHGAPGGPELIADQRRYHATARRGAEALRRTYPQYRYPAALATVPPPA